ncbi:hypothetical protein [Amycolatopsis sp. 3B14]|uniref:hypothetical protein n=1 Tax=Amycolatopsis sp. 3B14 TaxID=3243600 RepID=UPI003D957D9B
MSARAGSTARLRSPGDVDHAFTIVLVITDGDQHTLVGLDGVIIAEPNRSAPGVKDVGNGRPRGLRPKTPVPSPKS